jgi:hypothetical protein
VQQGNMTECLRATSSPDGPACRTTGQVPENQLVLKKSKSAIDFEKMLTYLNKMTKEKSFPLSTQMIHSSYEMLNIARLYVYDSYR